ncbi:hypothetical protein [Actinomadura sediminis]|uniref:Uncharacterized protein n=1 Tax=Actinomadura sediminis TaxID=1038904 RepID=A0ABW3EUH2_9ACTN
MPLSEVTATAARLRSRGIDGTFVELELLATRFRDAGLRVDVLGG